MSNSFANAMTVDSAESDRSPCMNYLFKKRYLESGLLWRTPSHSPGLYNHWPSLRPHMCPDIQDGWREQKYLKNTAHGEVCAELLKNWRVPEDKWLPLAFRSGRQRGQDSLLAAVPCARQSRWWGRGSLLFSLWAKGSPGHCSRQLSSESPSPSPWQSCSHTDKVTVNGSCSAQFSLALNCAYRAQALAGRFTV